MKFLRSLKTRTLRPNSLNSSLRIRSPGLGGLTGYLRRIGTRLSRLGIGGRYGLCSPAAVPARPGRLRSKWGGGHGRKKALAGWWAHQPPPMSEQLVLKGTQGFYQLYPVHLWQITTAPSMSLNPSFGARAVPGATVPRGMVG